MTAERVLRVATASVLGVAGGIVLAVVAVVVVLLIVVRIFSASGAEHARREAQVQFGKVAKVSDCRKMVDDPVEPEYRCTVTASRCTRSYLFALSHEFGQYAIAPAAKSDVIFDRPCSVPSDR